MIRGANISTVNLSGPEALRKTSGAMASQGAKLYRYFIAVLSTAVGFAEPLPIPCVGWGASGVLLPMRL